jgi:hypothetical protein
MLGDLVALIHQDEVLGLGEVGRGFVRKESPMCLRLHKSAEPNQRTRPHSSTVAANWDHHTQLTLELTDVAYLGWASYSSLPSGPGSNLVSRPS